MRKLLIVLGLIAAILAVVLSVLPLSNIAFIPAIVALILGFVAFYMSKGNRKSKKIIQLTFLLTIIALSLTTYKAVFNTVEVGDIQELEHREEESVEDSKEILDDIEIIE